MIEGHVQTCQFWKHQSKVVDHPVRRMHLKELQAMQMS